MDYKSLPSNIEAERLILGNCIYKSDNIDFVLEKIKVNDFFDVKHQRIFSAIYELHSESQKVDTITLNDRLSRKGELVTVGGSVFIEDLANEALTAINISSYVDIVKSKSVLRKLITTASEITEKASGNVDAMDAVEFAERLVYSISDNSDRSEVERISEVIDKGLKYVKENPIPKNGISGLDTGLVALNRKISGFQRSDLVLLAARPSMGKTALGLNFAMNAATFGKAKVCLFSLEMSKWQLASRMLAAKSLVELNRIKTADFDEDDWGAIKEAIKVYKNSNIFIDDTPAISVMEIRSKCRRLKSSEGLDIIVIDYLQLMSGHGENRQQEVSNISRDLKALARELDCTVIALSQLSREPDKRTNHKPLMSDLRESGAIEQDADIVMLIYREYYYDKSKPENEATVIVAKHRNGEVGDVNLFWKPEVQLFTDVAGIDDMVIQY
ncbi:MAG: replicative DNA helicase [Clostridiales bacterium]|nr:MAG: replicative DNA helicase [Clostridiales bacterium]